MTLEIDLQAWMDRTGVRFGTSGVRGLVDSMSDELCYAYARAFLALAAQAGQVVAIGHDLRPSSPRIAAACAQAARDHGCTVVYAGVLPTPALAWYALQQAVPAIMVTGSHIPFDRNGIKFYRVEGEITKADEQRITQSRVQLPKPLQVAALPAPDPRVVQAYTRRYLDFFAPAALAGQRIGLYEHSSAARDVLRDILQGLGASVISLMRTDHFVPVDTEAVSAADQKLAHDWALEHHFDAILSTDGDADRPLIGDEHGNWLRGDTVGVLCAQALGAHCVVTPVSSISTVEGCGSFREVRRTRIGSPYVIEAMQAPTAPGTLIVGFEANGGFLLGSDTTVAGRSLGALPTRDAVLPMLALLARAKQLGQALSRLQDSLPARYSVSDRLQDFAQEKSQRVLAWLRADARQAAQLMAPDAGAMAQVNEVDGYRVTFERGDIVHIRPSGNAPELRCYAEADSPARARQLVADCLQRLATAPQFAAPVATP